MVNLTPETSDFYQWLVTFDNSFLKICCHLPEANRDDIVGVASFVTPYMK